jgi:RNase P protein component
MKNIHWLICVLIVAALATGAQGQSAAASVRDGRSCQAPTSDFLALSHASGEVRVLDAKGLLLESKMVYLPRMQLLDLSQAELEALLETKTAYAALTVYGSLQWTNAQSAVIENQLQQVWQRGGSLAEKMQTRLEIMADVREYNYNLVFLPGSMIAASQYDARAAAVYDRQTNRAAMVATAAARVDVAEQEQASGVADSRLVERQARETYQEMAERLERANNQMIIANGQAAVANQQATDYLANCAAISTRLASHGINVPAAPPFYPIPPLTMRSEVDAERPAN